MISTTYLASTYNSGVYNSGTYNNQPTASSTGAAGTNGALTNTGFDLLLAATLACAIIFVALIVKFWRKPAKTAASE